MNGIVIALACVVAAAACLGVAVGVLRREIAIHRRPPTISYVPAHAPIAAPVDSKTEFLSREEILGREEPMTEMLLREELFVAPQPWAPPVPATEIIPRELLFARHQATAPTPSPAPAPIGLTIDEFEAQLITAEQAFTRWASARDSVSLERLAADFEPPLRQALATVAATSSNAGDKLLESALSSAETRIHRRQVAVLVLLLRNEIQAIRLIDQCVGGNQFVPELTKVLSLWRGRDTDWRFREQARSAGATRAFWLDRLDDRRIDPGVELLRELLASGDPNWIVRGLQLAKYHADPDLRMQAAQPHLTNMRQPAQRMAAVELAVFDRLPEAWMFCRQMANSPEFPRATELIASFGTARELQPILRRLDRCEGEDLWRLCRSGRKPAAALAARRLQDTRGDEFAAAALRYVVGDPPGDAKSVEALLERWVELAPNFANDRRYLHGELTGYADSIRRCLTSRDDRYHRALGDELFFRTRGNIRWLGRGFANDTIAAVAALRTHTIDFEISLGPG